MIPYLLAVLGGYLLGDSMEDEKILADGGILDSDVKDNISDYLVHKLDTEDFEVYLDNNGEVPEVKVSYTGFNDVIDIQNFLREANQALFDGNGKVEYNSVSGPVPEFLLKVMAKGGKTFSSFQDKVDAIAKKLEGTEVPAKLRKDYGRKYSREDAILAARRIAGAFAHKYDKNKKPKAKQSTLFADGGMTPDNPVNVKFILYNKNTGEKIKEKYILGLKSVDEFKVEMKEFKESLPSEYYEDIEETNGVNYFIEIEGRNSKGYSKSQEDFLQHISWVSDGKHYELRYAKGGEIGMTEVKKKIESDIANLNEKQKELYNQEYDYVQEAHWIDDRMMTDYINGWYGQDIIEEKDINDSNRDLGMKIIAYCSSSRRKMSKGGMIEARRQLGYQMDKLTAKQKKVYEKELKRIKADSRFETLTDKDMADYINGWYGEDLVSNMDFTGPKSFELGMKILAMHEAEKHPEFWEEELMVAEKGMKTEGGYPIEKTIAKTKKAIKFFEESGDEKQVAKLKKYLKELEKK